MSEGEVESPRVQVALIAILQAKPRASERGYKLGPGVSNLGAIQSGTEDEAWVVEKHSDSIAAS